MKSIKNHPSMEQKGSPILSVLEEWTAETENMEKISRLMKDCLKQLRSNFLNFPEDVIPEMGKANEFASMKLESLESKKIENLVISWEHGGYSMVNKNDLGYMMEGCHLLRCLSLELQDSLKAFSQVVGGKESKEAWDAAVKERPSGEKTGEGKEEDDPRKAEADALEEMEDQAHEAVLACIEPEGSLSQDGIREQLWNYLDSTLEQTPRSIQEKVDPACRALLVESLGVLFYKLQATRSSRDRDSSSNYVTSPPSRSRSSSHHNSSKDRQTSSNVTVSGTVSMPLGRNHTSRLGTISLPKAEDVGLGSIHSDESSEASVTESYSGPDQKVAQEEWQKVLGSEDAGHADFLLKLSNLEEDELRQLGLDPNNLVQSLERMDCDQEPAKGPTPNQEIPFARQISEDGDSISSDESRALSVASSLARFDFDNDNDESALSEQSEKFNQQPQPASRYEKSRSSNPLRKEAIRQLELDATDTEGEKLFLKGRSTPYQQHFPSVSEGSEGNQASNPLARVADNEALTNPGAPANEPRAMLKIQENEKEAHAMFKRKMIDEESRDTFMAREAAYMVPDFDKPTEDSQPDSSMSEDIKILQQHLGGDTAQYSANILQKAGLYTHKNIQSAREKAPSTSFQRKGQSVQDTVPSLSALKPEPGPDGFIDLGTLSAQSNDLQENLGTGTQPQQPLYTDPSSASKDSGNNIPEALRPSHVITGVEEPAKQRQEDAVIGIDDLLPTVTTDFQSISEFQEEEPKDPGVDFDVKPGFNLHPISSSTTVEWSEEKWEQINQRRQEEQREFLDQELKSLEPATSNQLVGIAEGNIDPDSHMGSTIQATDLLSDSPALRDEFLSAFKSHSEKYSSTER